MRATNKPNDLRKQKVSSDLMGFSSARIRLRILSAPLLSAFVLACSGPAGNVHIRTTDETKSAVDSAKGYGALVDYSRGKQLFKQHCNVCHPAPEENLVDQYLFVDLFDRLPSPAEEYFVWYLSDSKSLKGSGDAYAKHLDEVWDTDYEHRFGDSLSDQDFSALITYVKIGDWQRRHKKYN